MKKIIITTTSEIPGKKIVEILDIVKGNTIRAKNIGTDFLAVLKNVVGGEIKSYTKLTVQAREEALNRMINAAIKLKADAVVDVRFATSTVMQGASEMLAYGTAVKIK